MADEADTETREPRHIEGYYVPDPEKPDMELVPQPHGGALRTNGTVHGMGFRREVTPRIQEKADEIRADLIAEYPGIEDLSLPTVELFCIAMAKAIGLNNHIEEYTHGTRTRKYKGQTMRGYEAVPAYLWAEASRAETNAAKAAQDLGLDLTGRAKVMKDAAMSRHFGGNKVAELSAEGRRLRELRSGTKQPD